MSEPKILLYYAFAPVSDPEAVRLWQRELCESLGLRGRIIISKHGINGTVGGELDACKRYLRRTRDYGAFAKLDVKWSDGTGFTSPRPEPLHGIDRAAPWQRIADFLAAYETAGAPHFCISAINGEGCRPLIYQLQTALETLAPLSAATAPDPNFPEDD